MAKKTKAELKKYFETGDKPSELEYAELIDAFRHADDKLPIADVDSLQTSLDSKASSSVLLNHINDTSLHQSNMSGTEIKSAYEAEADTNAFTDAEKQQVADGALHRADNNSHVSSAEKIKWNNPLKQYEANEVLSSDMGETYRIFNGSLYKYIGDFPNANSYTTNDLNAELAENPARWINILSSYPPVEFVTISPARMQPNTTQWVEIAGNNIKIGTTVDFGTEINVLDYSYPSANKVLVELQSNGNVGHSVVPTINNGSEVSTQASFSISLGDLYIPGSTETPWTSQNANLIYIEGGVENTSTTSYYAGTFGNGIPIESDCSLIFTIPSSTSSQQLYFGYGNSTGSGGFSNSYFRSYANGANYGQNANASGYTMDAPLTGSTIEIKRIKQTANSCDIEVFQDGVLQDTFSTIAVNEVWYPFFYLRDIVKIESIELLIL